MPDNWVRNSVGRPGRILHRPEISWPAILIYISVYLIASLFIIYFLAVVSHKLDFFHYTPWAVITLVFFYLILSIFLFLKKICLLIIRIHQRYAPDQVRKMCNFEPSCSEYAELAINKYGVFKGIYLAYKRVRRCAPPGGIDYP